jgi:hypothetical protein
MVARNVSVEITIMLKTMTKSLDMFLLQLLGFQENKNFAQKLIVMIL